MHYFIYENGLECIAVIYLHKLYVVEVNQKNNSKGYNFSITNSRLIEFGELFDQEYALGSFFD